MKRRLVLGLGACAAIGFATVPAMAANSHSPADGCTLTIGAFHQYVNNHEKFESLLNDHPKLADAIETWIKNNCHA